MTDTKAPRVKQKLLLDPESESWRKLPWRKLEQQVYRIQKRIFRAEQRGVNVKRKVSQPDMHSWSEAHEPLRLQELAKDKTDPDPKALACYGMLVAENRSLLLRFVDGRPVSAVTTAFLEGLCEQMAASGKHVLVLIWDNASQAG